MTDEWWPEGYVNPAFTVQRKRFGTAVGGDYVRAHPGYRLPAYLTPTVGIVSTPDPGPLPTQCIFVFKVRDHRTPMPTGCIVFAVLRVSLVVGLDTCKVSHQNLGTTGSTCMSRGMALAPTVWLRQS